MKKAIFINDELGTMALGFSKAGYEIGAIYIDCLQRNAISICKRNWGDLVSTFEWDGPFVSNFIDADFIAGKIPVSNFCSSESRKDKDSIDPHVLKIIELLAEKRPPLFLFQVNHNIIKNNCFCEMIKPIGYQVGFEKVDVRVITGMPLDEKEYFIYGTLDSKKITLETLKDVYEVNYSVNDFCEINHVDEQYYCVNPRFLPAVEREDYQTILCWHKHNYEKVKYISWNPMMVPLVAQKNEIRKMTHKEIARLKGIPDKYYLELHDKSWLYKKLMYCANVQVVQRIISAINYDIEDKTLQSRVASKGLQFEKIIKMFFRSKGIVIINKNKTRDSLTDFKLTIENTIFSIVIKFYPSNVRIEEKILTICNRISNEFKRKDNYILIVGNKVDKELIKKVKLNYNIYIWNVQNLLWLFDEFPQIKSEFIALLSYTIADIKPQSPDPNIFEQKPQKLYNIELQERLRKIQPGKEETRNFEKLCMEIIRYIFSEDLEFLGEQKKSNSELYRFDYCSKIKHGELSEFFNTIQNFFNTKFIIFEFKNYSNEITQKEIYTTEKYLYEKALRKVAIIISRKGADANAQKAIRGCLRESGKLIICLSDEDINRLIDMKSSSGIPGDMLEELLDNMLMDLEK